MKDKTSLEDLEPKPETFYHQGKVALVMFAVLLVFSFSVIGIVTGLNLKVNSTRDGSRITPVPILYTSHKETCVSGWIFYHDFCYLIVSENKTWNEAKSLCQKHHADLMTVNSPDDLTFILKFVENDIDYWVGLKTDKTGKRTWPNSDYHWVPHSWTEDGHGLEESCVFLEESRSVDGELLHESDCSHERFYICQRKLEKTVSEKT